MIPKIIHYVWLGDNKKPLLIRKCLKSWKKKLPDYEVKLWNLNNIPHNTWVDEALNAEKWAFVSDYVRAWAVYNFGGIYLDSDVFVRKSFDDFLDTPYFTSIEYNKQKFYATKSNELLNVDGSKKNPASIIQGFSIQSAIFGAEEGSPYVKDIMNFYEKRHFINPDGSFYTQMIAPDIQAFALEKYGFKYQNETTQHLNGEGHGLYNRNFCERNKKFGQRLLRDSCVHIKLEKLFAYRKTKKQNKDFCKNNTAALNITQPSNKESA